MNFSYFVLKLPILSTIHNGNIVRHVLGKKSKLIRLNDKLYHFETRRVEIKYMVKLAKLKF